MNSELIRATLAEAGRHHQAGRLTEARRLYERVLLTQPHQPDALNLLGMIDYVEGNSVLAVERIRQAIAIHPRVPSFHTNLGTVLHAAGDSSAAVEALHQALLIKPDHVAALYNLGVVLQASGALEEAAKIYLAALKINPKLRDAWNNLGNCQAQVGQSRDAEQSFRRALQIDPNFPSARINLVGLLVMKGMLTEAERLCRDWIRQHPNQAEAHYQLGLVLVQCNRFAEAVVAFRAAPDHADALLHLANTLVELGDHSEAIAHYRALIARAPDHAAAHLALAVAAAPMMPSSAAHSAQVPEDFMRATAELERWSSAHPGGLAAAAGTAQPFLLAYRPSNVTEPLAHFGRLICREAARARPPVIHTAGPAITGARVRLGIVSGHVRTHPVWQVILRGVLEDLDRSKFDVRLYETGHFRDAETAWAENIVEHYQGQPLTIGAWVDHISRDKPDVLFYPECGMDPVAGALAPLRLAKLQAASWGHPVSTGLPSIDLYLSGAAIEPDDADAHYTERLVRLPGTGVSTRFDEPQPRRWTGPQRQPGHVRFALCQQPMKFDPADDALLARIAQAVGPSEFWIVQSRKHPWASDVLMKRLATAFVDAGLDPARHLHATPWMDQPEFSGFLDEMDVMLDCPAFSGYTTAWQAVHRGVPIVTLEGRFMRQRLAAGLLRQIDRTEGIARDAEHYVALAATHGDFSRNAPAQRHRRSTIAAAAARSNGNAEAIAAMQRVLRDV